MTVINLGSEINKLLKIFFNQKKTNFYANKWGFSALKIPKIQELQGGFAPLTPQQGHCPCIPPGACSPLEPRLIYGVNSIDFICLYFWFVPTFIPGSESLKCSKSRDFNGACPPLGLGKFQILKYFLNNY